jgi:hypothetical protein
MQSKALLKSSEKIHKGVRINSACATTSRSTNTASSIDLPGTEQYWLDVSRFYNTGVRRRAIILPNSL